MSGDYHQLFASVNEKTLKRLAIGMKDPAKSVACVFAYGDIMSWEQGKLGNINLLLTERQAARLDEALNAEQGLTLTFNPCQLRSMATLENNAARVRGVGVEPRSIRKSPGFISIGFEPPMVENCEEEEEDDEVADSPVQALEPAKKAPANKKAVPRNANFAKK